jgi:hypothetical protein
MSSESVEQNIAPVEQARKKFADTVSRDGVIAVALLLNCSISQVFSIASGRRNPGLRIAVAIWRHFQIPVETWVEE